MDAWACQKTTDSLLPGQEKELRPLFIIPIILFIILAKPGIWLDDLFVREEFRGRGAGEALMIRLAQICLERGGARIEWSTAARNELGIKFYERIGSVVLKGSHLTRLNEEALRRLSHLPSRDHVDEHGRSPAN